jgi:APA family basic amino acid/polyamine antiporter
VFADWLFFAATVATLFRLRRFRAGGYRIFKSPGHPVTTILFVAVALAVVVSCFRTAPQQAIIGATILAVGALLFPLVRRRGARRGSPPAWTGAPATQRALSAIRLDSVGASVSVRGSGPDRRSAVP